MENKKYKLKHKLDIRTTEDERHAVNGSHIIYSYTIYLNAEFVDGFSVRDDADGREFYNLMSDENIETLERFFEKYFDYDEEIHHFIMNHEDALVNFFNGGIE